MRNAPADSTGPAARRRRSRLGSALIEFTLLGIPVIFLFTSVVACSIDMWQFFTLSYAVGQTARYAALHGATCSQNGNTCSILRSDVSTFFTNQALALDAASTTVVLTDASGSVTCSPVGSCPSSTSQYPAAGSNAVGSSITVKATYTLINPIMMFWPGTRGTTAGRFTVGATSTQQIVF